MSILNTSNNAFFYTFSKCHVKYLRKYFSVLSIQERSAMGILLSGILLPDHGCRRLCCAFGVREAAGGAMQFGDSHFHGFV